MGASPADSRLPVGGRVDRLTDAGMTSGAATKGLQFTVQGVETEMAYIITSACTKDEKCVDVCPVDCIHPRKDEPGFAEAPQLYVDPVNCIDCGACVPVCEASAVFPLEEAPDEWKSFAEVNAAHYN
jgi:ferredoxin